MSSQADLESLLSSPVGRWIAKGVAFLVGGLGGAIIGALFLGSILGIVLDDVPNLHWYGGMVGGTVGAFANLRVASKRFRRRDQLDQVAGEMGFEPIAQGDDIHDQIRRGLVMLLDSRTTISIQNVKHKQIESAKFALADMTLTTQASNAGRSNSRSHTRHTTVALFESSELHWPTFELKPEGVMLRLMTAMVGVEDIDFDDYPIFSKKYHLSGADPNAVRTLFTPQLLDFLSDHLGLEVRGRDQRLMIVLSDQASGKDIVKDFVQNAMQLVELLIDASIDQPEVSRQEEGRPKNQSFAGRLSGIVGEMVRDKLLTPDQVNRFLDLPVPRNVPDKIWRLKIGSGNTALIATGIAMSIGGSLLLIYAHALLRDPLGDTRLGLTIAGGVLLIAGMPMYFFSWRHRRIFLRILRDGIVEDAEIVSVDPTDVSVNGQRQYRMKLEVRSGKRTRRVTLNVYGFHGLDAMRRVEKQSATRVLSDPHDKQRVLWPDIFLPTQG